MLLKKLISSQVVKKFPTGCPLLTYLLTPWSRVLLKKLIGIQVVKKFPAFYGTRRFITAFTKARHLFSPFLNKVTFYREELLEPRPTSKLEDHFLSTVRDCLFNIFAAAHHIGGRFSNRQLRKPYAVLTGTHLSWFAVLCKVYIVRFADKGQYTNVDR